MLPCSPHTWGESVRGNQACRGMGSRICQLRVGMGIATVQVMEVFWFSNWVAEPVGDPRQCAGRKDGGNIAAHRRLILLDEISRMPTDTLR
jgi:hypothetical protein